MRKRFGEDLRCLLKKAIQLCAILALVLGVHWTAPPSASAEIEILQHHQASPHGATQGALCCFGTACLVMALTGTDLDVTGAERSMLEGAFAARLLNHSPKVPSPPPKAFPIA